MPWVPELFSAPVLERFKEEQRGRPLVVPYFEGLLEGEMGPLVESFAGEPQIHHPINGRIRGAQAFEAFVTATGEWLRARDAEIEDVSRVVTEERGFEEVILRLDGGVTLPHSMVADHAGDGRLEEIRLYYSARPLTGRHEDRPPLLQRDPELRQPQAVAELLRALAAGDAGAAATAFEADGYLRGPVAEIPAQSGHEDLRAHFERLFSGGGGIELEPCSLTERDRHCALEYNVRAWGGEELPPQAGLAVFERGAGGGIAAARFYDDVGPPRLSQP